MAEELEKAMVGINVQGRLSQDNALEICYTPIIQSGQDCKLKFSAENTEKFIHYGSIVSTLGVRFMVKILRNYSFLLIILVVLLQCCSYNDG